MKRLAAPSASGEFLAEPGFEIVESQIAANRQLLDHSEILIAGQSLKELRQQARRELLVAAAAYSHEPIPDAASSLILTGHQPELSHPGVWVKNFAANGLASQLGGVALNLIVDTDAMRSASIRLPTWDGDDLTTARIEHLAFDDASREVPYELRFIANAELFASFGDRLKSATANWSVELSGVRSWPQLVDIGTKPLFEEIVALRRALEHSWGCRNLELPVSQLGKLDSFVAFVRHIERDADRFREVYNQALADYRRGHRLKSRSHPAPDLVDGELPFWRMAQTNRERAFDAKENEQLRPRALTLTLFARLILGDYFIHGLGGGKYDEVTDSIIRNFFGIEPPAFQILTATLHLPFSVGPASDYLEIWKLQRDVSWNPQRHLTGPVEIIERHRKLAAISPATSAERKMRYREFQSIRELLVPQVRDQLIAINGKLGIALEQAEAQHILTRRDYAWILYPESELKPFLQRFLSV